MSVYVYSYNNEMLYFGSTFNLTKRSSQHKSNLKNGLDTPFYNYLREQNLTFDDLEIEIVETAIYEKEALLVLERMMIEYWLPKCNRNIPGRTQKEYNEAHKEQIAQKKKEYNEANKEKKKEYYEAHKEKYKEYREANKEQITEYQKEYREVNKEQIAQQNKEYREAHKEKNKEYREVNKEKIAKQKKEWYIKNKK